MSQILTVFGATGNQGGSVIRHVLADVILSKTYKIRAVTRDVTQSSARRLAEQGVQVVSADLNSQDSTREAIKGSHTVFLATVTADFTAELVQGKNVTDAAKAAGVSHLIFSSLLPVKEITNGSLTHVLNFDTKAKIEKHIRESGVPATFYIPGSFMTNYIPQLQKAPNGSITLSYPVSKNTRFPLIDIAEDTGKFVKAIIKNRGSLLGKQIFAAADYYTPEQIVKDVESVTGRPAKYVQITAEEFASKFPEHAAQLFLENLVFMETHGYFNGASLDESLALLEEKPVTWKEFFRQGQ